MRKKPSRLDINRLERTLCAIRNELNDAESGPARSTPCVNCALSARGLPFVPGPARGRAGSLHHVKGRIAPHPPMILTQAACRRKKLSTGPLRRYLLAGHFDTR